MIKFLNNKISINVSLFKYGILYITQTSAIIERNDYQYLLTWEYGYDIFLSGKEKQNENNV